MDLLLLLCLMMVTVLLLGLVLLTAVLLQIYRILTQQNDANRYNIMMSDKLYLSFYIHAHKMTCVRVAIAVRVPAVLLGNLSNWPCAFRWLL